ncbi:protein mab-21-like [Mercenaria mercenaria]|uniref:protein mab-21-like n=1 Tax=Mercenaria mercenaria TaxID=6596 RepID=UPI00234F0DEF|nr:protein mab-21-like [Mercenaria mercenaria]
MATELISCKDQPEITRYKRINGLLLEAYDMKTGYNGGAKDKYGNICFNKDRVSYRTVVEDFLRTDVLEYVKRRDVRFSGTVHGVGSFFAGVSVSSNEADLLFVVDIEGALEDCKELPGYAKYRLSGSSLEKWKDCTTSDGYLMSRKLATLFYHYVEEALESKLRNNLTVSGTDITPEVCLTGIGTIASTLTVTYSTTAVIDIDLVVAVGCEGLPPLATAPWLEGKSAWPNSETVAKIRASGFQLVSKAPYPLNEDEETTLWRISFSLAETMLLQDLDEHINAYGLCTKICFVLMKFYRLCFLAPLERNVTPVLKSYYLR